MRLGYKVYCFSSMFVWLRLFLLSRKAGVYALVTAYLRYFIIFPCRLFAGEDSSRLALEGGLRRHIW